MRMNGKVIESFSAASVNVLSQLGFCGVSVGKVENYGKQFDSPGVVVIIGVIGDLHGNVLYTLSKEDAKSVASTMMGGMPLEEFDEMAQSAVSELTNMLAANACSELALREIQCDISTPTLVHGTFTATASCGDFTRVEFKAGEISLSVLLTLDEKERKL